MVVPIMREPKLVKNLFYKKSAKNKYKSLIIDLSERKYINISFKLKNGKLTFQKISYNLTFPEIKLIYNTQINTSQNYKQSD